MKYRKKPVVIEAIKWSGYNQKSMVDFMELIRGSGEKEFRFDNDNLIIHTLEGEMKVQSGDYIIKGVKGEIYPCKPDIFKETYEEIE